MFTPTNKVVGNCSKINGIQLLLVDAWYLKMIQSWLNHCTPQIALNMEENDLSLTTLVAIRIRQAKSNTWLQVTLSTR